MGRIDRWAYTGRTARLVPSPAATPSERAQVEIDRVGLHWEALDEDISIAGLLAGRGDVTKPPEHRA